MRLEFVPVEEFYFALTLAVRTLEEFTDAALVERTRSQLQAKLGQPSTVAAAKQNTFNYVFRVYEYDSGSGITADSNHNSASSFMVSIADWQDKLRLSSDYGWTLDLERKPVRTPQFGQREQFAQALCNHLQNWLDLRLESNPLKT